MQVISRRALLKGLLFVTTAGFSRSFTGCSTRSLARATPGLVIQRSAWRAVAPNHNASAERGFYDAKSNPSGWMVYSIHLRQALKTAVIHHSALHAGEGPREIQYKHMHERGFADIGYHFVIDTQGQVYEGRDIHVRGAHTAGRNTGTIGIVLLGDFEIVAPPLPQLLGLRSLVTDLSGRFALTHLAGHRDFHPESTVCPGRFLEVQLPSLAAEYRLQFGTGAYTGPAGAP